MPRQISELQSLPFHQIIGAPLLALVQGQAQAAQATADFIERVGFVKHDAEGANPDELGDIRMITFRYERETENGPATYQVELPLLSLVPIPALEIKEADLEFFVKINDIERGSTSSTMAARNPRPNDWLSPEQVEFKAAMGSMEKKASDERSVDLQMKINIKVQQADIPAGLASLFRIMDKNISDGLLEE